MGDLTDDLHGVYKALHTAGNEAVEDYENFKKTNFSDFEHNIFLMKACQLCVLISVYAH